MSNTLVNAIKKSNRARPKVEAKQKERNIKRSENKKRKREEDKKFQESRENSLGVLLSRMNSD